MQNFTPADIVSAYNADLSQYQAPTDTERQKIFNDLRRHITNVQYLYESYFGSVRFTPTDDPEIYRDVPALAERVPNEQNLFVFDRFLQHDFFPADFSFQNRAVHDLAHILCHRAVRCGFDFDELQVCAFQVWTERKAGRVNRKLESFLFTEIVGQGFTKVFTGDFPDQIFVSGGGVDKIARQFFKFSATVNGISFADLCRRFDAKF